MIGEPADALLFAIRYPKGWKQSLHNYGLNPVTLTPEQLKHPPTLFLHGDLHNSSGCLPLANYFHRRNYKGAIFTVNYPTAPVTEESAHLIQRRIREIESEYKGNSSARIKFNLVGHSRGCQMITKIASERNDSINEAILIGMGDDEDIQRAIQAHPNIAFTFISGKSDTFFPVSNQQADSHRFFVNAGHLGSLSHPDTLEICYKKLASKNG